MHRAELVFLSFLSFSLHLFCPHCSPPTIPHTSSLSLPNAEMVHLSATGTKMKTGTLVPARLVHVVGLFFFFWVIAFGGWGGKLDQPELDLEDQRACNVGSSVRLQRGICVYVSWMTLDGSFAIKYLA